MGDVIQPSHPLPTPSPFVFSLSQNQGLFPCIIDSTTATPELIAKVIAENAEEFEKKPFEQTKLMLSPYVLFPTKPFGTDDGDDIVIALKDGFHFTKATTAEWSTFQ